MGSPVLWFPPGYPLLLSPLFRLRDLPLLEISIVQWLLAVALLWGIYRWARPLAPRGRRLDCRPQRRHQRRVDPLSAADERDWPSWPRWPGCW